MSGRKPETKYLAFLRPRKVPVFAKFSSAADVRDGQDAPVMLQERHHSDTEERIDGDVEPAVALHIRIVNTHYSRGGNRKSCCLTILQSGGSTVSRCQFVPDDEHRYFRPVVAVIPHLLRLEVVCIQSGELR